MDTMSDEIERTPSINQASSGMGTPLALLAFLTFSTSDLCSKLLHNRLPAYEVAFFGGLLGILLFPVLWKKEYTFRSFFPVGKTAWLLWLLRAFCVFAATALAVTAFMLLPLPIAQALMFLMPLVTAILTVVVLREKVPFSTWVVALVGLVGVATVAGPDLLASFQETLQSGKFNDLGIGGLCAIGVALTAGVNIMAARGLNGKANDLSIYAAVVFGPIIGDGIVFGNTFVMPSSLDVCLELFGYGFLAALAQLFLIYASQKIAAAKITLAQYSQLIWTTVFAIIIFKDMPAIHTYVGLGIILLSGVFGAILQKREGRASLVNPEV
ncbi:DMT family transporter [Acetobacteraceae bacterium]|nr:DMT family transporter [Acetobacteraceae bacterium]